MSQRIRLNCVTCGNLCDPKIDFYDEDGHQWHHIGNRCAADPLQVADRLAEAAQNAELWLMSCIPVVIPSSEPPLPKLRKALAEYQALRKGQRNV